MKHLDLPLTMIIGVFLLISSLTLAAEEQKMGGEEATITGQVVDPACYVSQGLNGETHAKCATACAKAGQALGLLDKKASILYQVLEPAPGADPNKLLIDHVEKDVTVKGKVFHKDGMHAIVPAEVKPSAS
ncbi:MAG: hypothetical protein HYW01_04345 [Deltaproteobacteria bacterium]|nr:hypothetical protein [Deltaproteobacteria bacterium]